MTADPFTDPDDPADEWVDVRMTDPDAGEWDVDVVVADGRVEYIDLRVRPELLADFVACLIEDVDDARGSAVLADVADDQDLDPDSDSDSGAPDGA